MKVIKPYIEILTEINGPQLLKNIEKAGRVCYKSEDKITDDSAVNFVKNILKRGHEAVIEHQSITVKIVCDRGVTHEIVRHRIASYCQESTRYCNYSNDKFDGELTFIEPCFWESKNLSYEDDEQYKEDIKEYYAYFERKDKTFNEEEYNKNYLLGEKLQKIEIDTEKYKNWLCAMESAENLYLALIKSGATPQEARSVLPNSLKTEIVITMNLREWRHFLKLRTAKSAHPQMIEIANMVLKEFKEKLPVLFDDIGE